jgi:hypothetical protein
VLKELRMLVELLARIPAMAELPEMEARVISALRHWVTARKAGGCGIAAAGSRLGSRRGGAHLHLLLEEIAAAWPEPFAISPLCCRRVSHDEQLLGRMISLGAAGNRPAFDRLLADLLPCDVRERLFVSAGLLGRFASL